jgi:transposase
MDTEIGCFKSVREVMQRRKFSRAFKIEAVKLVRERGVSVAQEAATWAFMRTCCANGKEFGSEPVRALPGHGQMKPEQLEIEPAAARGHQAECRASSAAGREAAVTLMEALSR